MSIPESQLTIWANQGATVTSKATADSVKYALNNYTGFPTNNYEVYLQGSYKNDTNIRGESDVDVVIQLNNTFYHNLTMGQMDSLHIDPASYVFQDFYNDTIIALTKYYGASNVNPDDKCVKIKENNNRLPADVIITTEYRRYYYIGTTSYTSGVCFFTRNSNRKIINYPKQVYDNGVIKNGATNGMFKRMVRIFKNMRKTANVKAPSYFIQCLIYNIPNYLFTNNYFDTTVNILEHIRLISDDDLFKFVCQHEQFNLFGSSEEQWDRASARLFNRELITFWNNWGM